MKEKEKNGPLSNMRWIGLTGGIGTGKSSLTQFLKEMNQPVIEADQLVHEALSQDPLIYKKVLKSFGEEILDENQNIHRKKLGEKVFSHPERLLQLESILHPVVKRKAESERERIQKLGFNFCFYEIPLLFEKNLEKDFDEIVVISLKENIQKERVAKRNKFSEEEIQMRLKAQMSLEEKKKKASFVIENEGSLEELKEKAKGLLEELKKKTSFLFIFFVTFFYFLLEISAGEKKEFFNEVRGLGMGGARLATVNDVNAILINPAALGKIREPVLHVADPEISMNKATPGIINFNLIRSFQLQKIFEQMKKKKGNKFYQKFQIFPSFAFTNFGLGILAKYELNEEVLDPLGKTEPDQNQDLFLSYVNDLAFATGFSFRFLDGRLKIGGSLRLINRVEIHERLNSEEVELSVSSLAHEGFGIGKDLALIFSLPWLYIPSVSAVLRDVFDTKYNFFEGFFYARDDKEKKPRTTKQSLDVGVAFFPLLGNRKFLTVSAEFRDVLNSSNNLDDKKDIFRRFHIGTEVNIHDSFLLRLGLHQRYWALGFEVNRTFFQWQFSSYGEEIGTEGNSQVDRRFVGKFIFRF